MYRSNSSILSTVTREEMAIKLVLKISSKYAPKYIINRSQACEKSSMWTEGRITETYGGSIICRRSTIYTCLALTINMINNVWPSLFIHNRSITRSKRFYSDITSIDIAYWHLVGTHTIKLYFMTKAAQWDHLIPHIPWATRLVQDLSTFHLGQILFGLVFLGFREFWV